jgi:UDP-N-acetylmuramate dehydrogenase
MKRPSQLRERVALAPFTTLQVGGEARMLVQVNDAEGLAEALAWSRASGLPSAVLGGGSNLLVSDRGFDGVVIQMRNTGMRHIAEASDEVLLEVGAGESLDQFVRYAVSEGYGGVECLSGIPGSVGATPLQNVGAYGQEVGDTIREVHVVERTSGTPRVFDNRACAFAYRTSIFKADWVDRYVVVRVTFALKRQGKPTLRYAELERAVNERGVSPRNLAQVREVVLSLRRAKSMLVEASDPNHRSAGSFFVNPIVTSEVADAVEQAASGSGPGPEKAMPRFPAEHGVKLSAAWLIERAGFAKGMSDGPVGISTRHALCIVNRGGASAQQIVAFAGRIRAQVRARFGVSLSVEPVRLGFSAQEDAPLTD